MKTQIKKESLEKTIKNYRQALKALVNEIQFVDETSALEYDGAIHKIAKKLMQARNKQLHLNQ